MQKRLWLMVAMAALLAVGLGAGSWSDPPPPDVYENLNQHFRLAYRQARQQVLKRLGPVVTFDGDKLILAHAGRREEAVVIPAVYHRLKTIAHVPFTVVLIVGTPPPDRLSDEQVAALTEVRSALPPVRAALSQAGLAEANVKIADDLLSACDQYMAQLLKEGPTTEAAQVEWVRARRPAIDALVHAAAQAQLSGMHKQMSEWRMRLPADAWGQLRVIVQGSAMPRRDNIAVQYFAKLLGEPGEGKRIVYAENLWDAERSLNLLGTHEVDRRAAVMFFNDAGRLHRDLLADAAKAVLAEMNLDP